MKAILVIDLGDNVNLDEVEICYVIQDKYGMPVKVEVDGCPLKPMPSPMPKDNSNEVNLGFELGWNACLEDIEKLETKSDLSTDEGWWRDYELYEMQND